MIFPSIRLCLSMACVMSACAQVASGQALAINNDIQTYATLPSTTVTMTGRSELRITGAATPITGSTIHLNSADSWFFMTNVRPSVVSSTYLGQIRVNGAAAVLNTNCRIVQYAEGTVVIPHSSTFAPLQVFSGSHFTGSSLSLQNYTAYNDASLGVLANNISSFKLKRGYTATIAQNASGTGVSRNYVAQDGDIEVSVLPNELNDSVSFVRVFPWRWVTKKGSCDVDPTALNAKWHYNWDINKNSAPDWEYGAIKQQPNWPSLTQNWQTRQINHLLGFNEPNNPVEDAYLNLTPVGSVSDAVARWPELLGTGLRVGAPAVTDAGYSWIVDFVNQAEAAGHRVDFIPIHYYRSYANNNNPQGAADSMYNFLKGIHDATGRPVWVTEFNNGANWTTDADPDVTQNRNVVEAMVNMMDDTPWIERYAVYSKVEWFRQTHYDDGSITPMGTMYRDHVAPLSYQQVIPEVPTSPAALYRFENNARDSSAYGHAAILKGGAKFTAGHSGQAVSMSGNAADGDCVQLSTRLGDSMDFTFGAWVYPTSATQWQRIFDLGSGTTRYMFLTPAAGGSGNLRFAIADGGAEQQLNHNAPLALNTWSHVAVTLSGNTGKLFVNGALVATNTGMTLNPVSLDTSINFLGKSQFAADPLFAGKLDDVEFLPYALTDAKVLALTTNTPPQFTSATISDGSATQNVAYNGTIAGSATDADAGDTLTFSKVSGPEWLAVAPNGVLSGTPTFDDAGTQEFIVYATDSVGVSAVAVLTLQLPSVSGNGTWSTDANGSWSETAKWSGNFPANGIGNAANFSTLNIAADRTVTLDASRTIGALQFGDTGGTQGWTLAAANGRALTLETAAGTPSVVVNQNTAIITASLEGTAGFTKSGAGTLVLKGDNPLSGILFVDTSLTSGSSGAVRLASPNAATGLTGIQIRNNNDGSSTFELDGSSGAVTTPAAAAITLSGRGAAVTVPAIRNLAGGNVLSGNLTIGSGGANYYFQSDAGTLTFDGTFTSAATGSRVLTFLGAGNFTLNGVLSNGSAATGVSIVKNGAGTLTLAGANTHTGTTTIGGGAVTLNGAGNLGAASISMAAGTTLNINKNLAITNTVTGSGAIFNTGSAAVTGDFSGFSGSYTHNSNVVSTAFNTALATSRNASYTLASDQGSSQGFIAAGTGDYTLEMGSLSGVAGSLFRGGNSAAGTTTLKVGNLNATDTFAGTISNGAAKVLALHKVGSGTLILSGANGYTGATTLAAGKLVVNGSITSSNITAAAGATLGGSGSIASATVAGKLAPGNSAGTLAATGNISLTGTWETEIDGSSADRLNVTGTLTLTGSTLDFNVLGGGTTQAIYVIASYGTLAGMPTVLDLPFGYVLNTNYNSLKQIALVRTAAPFAIWANNYSLTGTNAAATADPDADGITNSIEYLLGMVPTIPNTTGLPTAAVSGDNLVFTFTRNKAAALEFSSTVETSPSLTGGDWTPVPAGNIVVQDNGSTETVTAAIPLGGAPKLFARLNVR